MRKKAKKSSTGIMASHVRREPRMEATPEQNLVIRHQAALRAMDRLDAARELRPHVPRLANDVLRADDAIDYSAHVIQAIVDQAGPLPSFGPRTGSHPMATYCPPPPRYAMATRLRPPLMTSSSEEPHYQDAVITCLAMAALFFLVIAAVMEVLA